MPPDEKDQVFARFHRRLPAGTVPSYSGNHSVERRERRHVMMDRWLINLKTAYDAGYYRTEADLEHQSGFPWQNKRCRDCPF
jgi:hypothetical protein